MDITVAGSVKTAETDIHGEAEIIGLKEGSYNITFTLKEHTPVTKTVHIEKRRMIDVVVVVG